MARLRTALFRFGEDHQSAGVLVDAMHQAKTGKSFFADGIVLLPEIPRDTIDQRARVIAAGRMNDQPRAFVDDHHLIVLIIDVEGHFFRNDLFSGGFLIGVHDDLIQGSDLVIWRNLFVVDQHHAGFEGFLDLIPGGVLYPLDEEFIDAQGFLTFIDLQVHSFVQLVGSVG